MILRVFEFFIFAYFFYFLHPTINQINPGDFQLQLY